MESRKVKVVRDGDNLYAHLSSRTRSELQETRAKVSKIGGLIVQNDEALTLNTSLELLLESPEGDRLSAAARVVQVGAFGAALEIERWHHPRPSTKQVERPRALSTLSVPALSGTSKADAPPHDSSSKEVVFSRRETTKRRSGTPSPDPRPESQPVPAMWVRRSTQKYAVPNTETEKRPVAAPPRLSRILIGLQPWQRAFRGGCVGEFLHIASMKSDAVVEIRWRTNALRFGLRRGLVILAEERRRGRERDLADQLCSIRRIDEETSVRARDWARQRGQRIEDALLAMSVFNKDELIWVSRLAIGHLLRKTCEIEEGTMKWCLVDELPVRQAIPPLRTIPFLSRLFMDQREEDPTTLDERWRRRENKIPRLIPSAFRAMEDLELTKGEQRAIAELRKGLFSPGLLLLRTGLSKQNLIALLELLALFDAIEWQSVFSD